MARMKMYLIRCSCEYSQVVEALTALEAIEKANETPRSEWESKAWSADEADLVPPSSKSGKGV
jgi:hypothetical protein